MIRHLFGVLAVLAWVAVASAEPPSDRRVLSYSQVPPVADNVLIVKNREKDGLILPVPGLGFLPVPLAVWRCDVFHTPRGAPAGTLPARNVVRLFTLVE